MKAQHICGILGIVGLFMASIFIPTRLSSGTTFAIIVAGGSGERLWPLSKKNYPKQLLSLSESKTLLEQAIERVRPLVTSQDHIIVVTTAPYEQEIKRLIKHHVGEILVEPMARNTAAAIAYATIHIATKDPDAHLIFVPADAFIPSCDIEEFVTCGQKALLASLTHDGLCLIGVKPTFPATQYGYIEYAATDNPEQSFKVKSFHEKPTVDHAQRFISQPNILWNISIFAGSAKRFLKEFEEHAPDILNSVRSSLTTPTIYATIPSISIDYAVIEKSSHISVVPASFSWCDIGNIATFLALKIEGLSQNNVISIDAKNNLVDVPTKLVALIGVDDLCVVETAEALLITKKESVENVRQLITYMKQHNLHHYL